MWGEEVIRCQEFFLFYFLKRIYPFENPSQLHRDLATFLPATRHRNKTTLAHSSFISMTLCEKRTVFQKQPQLAQFGPVCLCLGQYNDFYKSAWIIYFYDVNNGINNLPITQLSTFLSFEHLETMVPHSTKVNDKISTPHLPIIPLSIYNFIHLDQIYIAIHL